MIEPVEAELAEAGPEYTQNPRVEFPADAGDAAENSAAAQSAAEEQAR